MSFTLLMVFNAQDQSTIGTLYNCYLLSLNWRVKRMYLPHGRTINNWFVKVFHLVVPEIVQHHAPAEKRHWLQWNRPLSVGSWSQEFSSALLTTQAATGHQLQYLSIHFSIWEFIQVATSATTRLSIRKTHTAIHITLAYPWIKPRPRYDPWKSTIL